MYALKRLNNPLQMSSYKKYKCDYYKFIQMQNLDIFLTIVIGLIFSGAAMLSLQESYAQQNASLSISRL